VHIIDFTALLLTTLLSAALTGIVRRYAMRSQLMDLPNARSSHVFPTPRGGGIAVVLTIFLGVIVLMCLKRLSLVAGLGMVLPAGAVAIVGFMDDRYGLPVVPRLMVHLAAATTLVGALLLQSNWGLDLLLLSLLAFIGIAWNINLFNFMDGIDGIASSEALFVAGASGVLLHVGGHNEVATTAFLSAAACLGFLLWNWPPAKIFMGDVGSGFLGFWLGALALWAHVEGGLSLWTSLLLGSVFVADATVTLLARMARGAQWHQAHRAHAYQHLSRKWRSHAKVTSLVWSLNLFVVFPLALLSFHKPALAPIVSIGALILFGALALLSGAGRSDAHNSSQNPTAYPI
jgi:Fuc2NAc and GlcNAc transferase